MVSNDYGCYQKQRGSCAGYTRLARCWRDRWAGSHYGALHSGHVSLVELARHHADVAVASIFVNPTQFGPNEDFTRYPRTEKHDLEKLEAAKARIAYLPTVEDMYPRALPR